MIIILMFLQLLFILFAVALYTLLERKLLGYQQSRKGPNKPGVLGYVVPFADAVKLATKEYVKPINRNKTLFLVIPSYTLLIPLTL